MPSTFWLLIALWSAWVLQSLISALRVRAFARLLSQPASPEDLEHRPDAVVVVPAKGVDLDLDATVRSLLAQNYPQYRAVFVVESKDDPAYTRIAQLIEGQDPRQASLLVAGRAPTDVGQKLHNQLFALATLEQRGRGERVWAFLDSDAVPNAAWLGDIVGPLHRSSRDAVCTGYRWLIPKAPAGQERPSIWSQLASVMNASVACMQGIPGWSQAWGGSMAMLTDTARQGDIMGRWRGALSDDYPATTMSKALGKRVRFVPRCLLPSPVNFDLYSLCNFVRRQYLITRVYAPSLYYLALAIIWLYVTGYASAWGYGAYQLLTEPERGAWIPPAIAIGAVWIGNQIRASARQRCVQIAFDTSTAARLSTSLQLDRWATPLWMTLHGVLILSALVGRSFVWRGVRYHLRGPNDVSRIDAVANSETGTAP